MFISRKKKQFIYTILYLLPLIFIFYSFFSFIKVSSSETLLVYSDLKIFIKSFCNDIFSFTNNSNYRFIFPITQIAISIFNAPIVADFWFFCFVLLFLDISLWISVFIICFDVITLIPVIAHKFVHRLSGVNE